jgi:hypothetical protein
LPDKAALALFLYLSGQAQGGEVAREFERTYRLTGEASRRLKAAIRAEKLERTRAGSRGPSHKPASEARAEALASAFPARSGDLATVGDAFARLERETGRRFTVAQMRQILVKSGGRRSPLDSRLCLAALQELAGDYGVRLGFRSLAELADCAGPWKYGDEDKARELQHYLKANRGKARQIADAWKPLTMNRSEFPHLFDPL